MWFVVGGGVVVSCCGCFIVLLRVSLVVVRCGRRLSCVCAIGVRVVCVFVCVLCLYVVCWSFVVVVCCCYRVLLSAC